MRLYSDDTDVDLFWSISPASNVTLDYCSKYSSSDCEDVHLIETISGSLDGSKPECDLPDFNSDSEVSHDKYRFLTLMATITTLSYSLCVSKHTIWSKLS